LTIKTAYSLLASARSHLDRERFKEEVRVPTQPFHAALDELPKFPGLDGYFTRAPITADHATFQVYTAFARAHMKAYSTAQEKVAAFAAKNHGHAVRDERALYRKNMTAEQSLAARPLDYPMTVPMCSDSSGEPRPTQGHGPKPRCAP